MVEVTMIASGDRLYVDFWGQWEYVYECVRAEYL